LFAYGKKYNVSNVVLIYPLWQGFNKEFDFLLDEELMLLVKPFDLTKETHEDFLSFLDE